MNKLKQVPSEKFQKLFNKGKDLGFFSVVVMNATIPVLNGQTQLGCLHTWPQINQIYYPLGLKIWPIQN